MRWLRAESARRSHHIHPAKRRGVASQGRAADCLASAGGGPGRRAGPAGKRGGSQEPGIDQARLGNRGHRRAQCAYVVSNYFASMSFAFGKFLWDSSGFLSRPLLAVLKTAIICSHDG